MKERYVNVKNLDLTERIIEKNNKLNKRHLGFSAFIVGMLGALIGYKYL